MKTSLTRIQGGRALALVALALHAPACDDTTGARSSSSAAPTSAPLPAPFGSVWNGLTARSSSPAAPSPAPRPPAIATASSSATDAAAPLASSSASSSPAASAPLGVDTAPLAEPLLREPSGKLLPQTEEKPSLESPIFKRHVASLVRAIEVDDVELARSFFFPVDAYEVVKGIKEPAKDWNRRLFKAFKRDVHEYHRQLKGDAAGSKLVRLNVPEQLAKWMKPQSEGNSIGYHRVLRSHLIVADGAGKEHDFELTSMISWRGEWYVVHLHGFD